LDPSSFVSSAKIGGAITDSELSLIVAFEKNRDGLFPGGPFGPSPRGAPSTMDASGACTVLPDVAASREWGRCRTAGHAGSWGRGHNG
jgi:hypothetical protein